jgi:abequosyltransferase
MRKLSICIPTYNRSRFLAYLLDSILDQDGHDVEIIVSDDASPDDTIAILETYRQRAPHLKIVRQPVNIGLDKNFLAVATAASAPYIWFMGDDDRLEPGAIGHVLAAIDAWPGIAGLTLKSIDYAPDFSAITGIKTLPPTGLLHGTADIFCNVGELLGFMSTMVVRRDLWNDVCATEPIVDFFNLYVQVYIAGQIMRRHPVWGIVNEVCVGYRSDNDQFLSKLGWFQRMKADVLAYDQLAMSILADDTHAICRFRKRIFKTHILARILNAKTCQDETPHLGDAILLLCSHYWWIPSLWYFEIPLLLAPNQILKFARRLYRARVKPALRRNTVTPKGSRYI